MLVIGRRMNDMKIRSKIQVATTVKIIISILSVTGGILSLILLRGMGYSYTVYVTVLMLCIATSLLLLLSSIISGILQHKNVGQEKSAHIEKWSYTISSGVALLVIAPLIIILLAGQGVAFTVYIPCFFGAIIMPIVFVVTGVVKCINMFRD